MNELSEAFGPPLLEEPPSLWETFSETVQKYPDYLAVASVHQSHDLFGIPSLPLEEGNSQGPYLRWTYKNLLQGVSRLTAGLKDAGVKAGVPIFSFQANGAEWSAAEMGCVYVPISPRNLTNKSEVTHMIKTALMTTPGKKPVVIAGDFDTAVALDDLGLWSNAIKIIVSESSKLDGWTPFEKFMNDSAVNGSKETSSEYEHESENIAQGTVLFTSGTTSMPKGIFAQQNNQAWFVEAWAKSRPPDGVFAGSRFCCVLPNNHSFAHYMVLCAQSVGAAIVYPAPSFDTTAMLETLYQEKVTQVSLPIHVIVTVIIPTIIYALIAGKAAYAPRLEHLTQVIVGGAVLSPDFRRSCIQVLGAKSVENWYGMTEGLLVRPGNQGDLSTLVHGNEVSIGWVMPGYTLRIADPETNVPVPRNTEGELQGSSNVITKYIGGAGADSYYVDNEMLWFKSGDQARMDSEGRIFITGRYKEMIIRAGANISPAAIETVIAKDPRFAALLPQIVGTPDTVAGEVPIAVVIKNIYSDIKEAIRDTVRRGMGLEFIPDEVISVQDLGLSDYPRTMAGKIQKTKLAEVVKAYRANRDKESILSDSSELATVVKNIWAKAAGLECSRLPMDTPVGEFADSITAMRVRDFIRKQTGKNLPIADMAKIDTINGQIEYLQKQPSLTSEVVATKRPIRQGPPGADGMVHLTEDPGLFEPTKRLITQTVTPYGFDWDDVEDVMPAYDLFSVLAERGVIDSWSYKFGILTNKADKKELRTALEMMFTNNRILASFLVWDKKLLGSDIALHVAVRQNKKIFDLVIQDGGSVKTVGDIMALTVEYPSRDHAAFPGPLTRAMIYHVEETGSAAVVFICNHSIMDAASAQIFREDLDSALGGTASLPEHIDYKPYADSYYNLRTSVEANAAAKWHIERLQGLESHRKGLIQPFPISKSTFEASLKAGPREEVKTAFIPPGLDKLRKEHSHITATALTKTAFALVLVHHTGHSHAVFQNFEAARKSFPFLPPSFEAMGEFGATDVAGPTMQVVVNLIHINPEETVLSLLNRVQEEQALQVKHASAPFGQILKGLGPDADLLIDIVEHQAFNWLPGMGNYLKNPYANMQAVKMNVMPSMGLGFRGGVGGPDSNLVIFQSVGLSVDIPTLRRFTMQVEKITRWLMHSDNWEAGVGEFAAILED